jgi:CRP-like cAMP-binding protein
MTTPSDNTTVPTPTEGDASVAVRPRDSADILDSLWNNVDAVVSGSLLFRSLDETGRRELVGRGVVMVFPANYVVLREGERSTDFYLVDRGVVEVTTVGPNGTSMALATLQRGAFFGEVAMLTGMPRTATVTALTDTSVVRFDKSDIDAMLDRDPVAKRLLNAMVEGRARDTFEKIAREIDKG